MSVSSLQVGAAEDQMETSYLYVKVLGRGAFGEAVLYRKTEDNSFVVWKEVNLGRLGEKEKRDALNEVEILSLLNHANVITYYNHFLDNQTLLIEMEYANGGSLYEKLAYQKELFAEEQVKWYLYQIASALDHIHSYDIIHRDIKTMNIFMTKTDLLKIGDFGISRVLESNDGFAESVVGTPYYMSPEIVQGATYNHKTDVWAMGCVLFELLTLTKTFQATNQLRLAYEIVKNEHGEIDARYSDGIQQLVNQMLQKDPDLRPTSNEVLNNKLFHEDDRIKELQQKIWELNSGVRKLRHQSSIFQDTIPVIKSKATEVYQWGGGKATPLKQDIFTKERSAIQVSTGKVHFAVVTVEKELYTWAVPQGGEEIVGQLGHGNKSTYRSPKRVEAIEGVIQVSCGEDFTVCVTDDHNVYSFGSDYYGCLGVDNELGDEVLTPSPIPFFNSHPVIEISCGQNHVFAITREKEVYSWGCGEFGRLGLGNEDDFTTPQLVKTPGTHCIDHAFSGFDGTFLITTSGRVLACGSNENNKLGFNSLTSGLRKRKQKVFDIPCQYTFTTVKPLLRYNIVTVFPGATHTAAVDIFGHLYMFGSNRHGQLGLGDTKRHSEIKRVGGVFVGKMVENVACGDSYTVVNTNESEVYSWGNGSNGRLGVNTNNQSTALPRTILGSHQVSNIAANHWHTVAILEKVLNQKTLRNVSPKVAVTPPLVSDHDDDSAYGEDFNFKTPVVRIQEQVDCFDSGKPDSPEISSGEPDFKSQGSRKVPGGLSETTTPDWLLAELDDAEVIPIPTDLKNSQNESVIKVLYEPGGPMVYADQEHLEKSQEVEKPNACGCNIIIAELQAKILELEHENADLRQQINTK